MSLQFKLPTLRWSRQCQALPVVVSTPSTPSPTFNLIRPRFLRRRVNIIILGLTVFTICLVGWHAPTRNVVGGYASRGQEKMKSWSGERHHGPRAKYWAERIDDWIGYCRGWDPDHLEGEDPEHCLKSKQYRQTMRVLEREERAEHEHWQLTREHNVETFRNISECFLPTWHGEYRRCIDKPLILSGYQPTAEVILGKTTAAVIWQSAVTKQLKLLGMSYVAVGPYDNWVELAELMPDVYRFIWISDVDIVSCSTDPRCVAKEHYVHPDGADDLSIGVPDEEMGTIKLWQMLVIDYLGARPDTVSNSWEYWGPNTKEGWSYQPLGEEWIATPWALPGKQFHLAHSIEDWCMSLSVVPHEQRNNTVLLLAERSSHLAHPELFSNLMQDPSFDLVTTARTEEGHPLPDGLTTLGPQSQAAYSRLLSQSKVLLGVGQPKLSPSVYAALCQAVPVLLPAAEDDPRLDGWHMFGDSDQHGPASSFGPPCVYSYFQSNYSSLVEAVHQAFTTPIDRYIPDDMKSAYALAKANEYLNRDLEGMFTCVVRENKGQIPGMAAGIRERCYELKRCQDMSRPGTVRIKLKSGGVVRTGIDT